MRCIDTHCHYNLEPLFNGQRSHFRIKDDDSILAKNWQIHWESAKNAGVLGGIAVGADLENSAIAISIHKQQPKILAAVGLHPELPSELLTTITTSSPELSIIELKNEVTLQLNQHLEKLSGLARNNEIVAIGETGCDYYYFTDDLVLNEFTRDLQAHLFAAQIKLANQLKLPVIVHTRDKKTQAYTDALSLIKQHYEFHKPFVLHCVSGPLEYVQAAIELGAYVGFDGNLTYKNNQDLLEILAMVPANRIVIETDSPYLPPTPYRGQVCEPWMVTSVATAVCDLKKITEETLLQNTVNLFGKPIETLLSD